MANASVMQPIMLMPANMAIFDANASLMQHIMLVPTNMGSAHGQCIFDATIQDMPLNMGRLIGRAFVKKMQFIPSPILCMVPPPPS
jgi:hypothetical protein